MKTKSIKPIFKEHKNKINNNKWILEHFPEDYQGMNYLEPYCGGINLLLLKEKSIKEVINDLDVSLISIYQCLRDEPKEFIKKLNHYKYCEETFEKVKKKEIKEDYLEKSICEYVLKKMSKSELKKTFSKTNFLQWKKSIQDLYHISYRLQEVFIFNKEATEIIEIFNSNNCFIYCDPPFLHESKNSKKLYLSDMETDGHIKLSHVLNNFKGKVIIRGIKSPLYNRLYKNWNLCKIKKNPEIIWKNF